MISISGHEDFSEVNFQGMDIMAVRYGRYLIWEKIRSCYGAGYWINEKPWLNKEAWKNN